MIYLDSSALVKLLTAEAETPTLRAWLSTREPEAWVSSALAVVEVARACQRLDRALLPAARSLLAGLDLLPLSSLVLEEAADLADPALRSLDALHLASALSLGPALDAFVAYDLRLVAAAEAAGLDVVQPGA